MRAVPECWRCKIRDFYLAGCGAGGGEPSNTCLSFDTCSCLAGTLQQGNAPSPTCPRVCCSSFDQHAVCHPLQVRFTGPVWCHKANGRRLLQTTDNSPISPLSVLSRAPDANVMWGNLALCLQPPLLDCFTYQRDIRGRPVLSIDDVNSPVEPNDSFVTSQRANDQNLHLGTSSKRYR